jgi:UTP--glucose-1-phosphate uridylyltransferase
MKNILMKAVIPVAGFGTRFLPATKAQPKEMLPVYDKPALQYIVEEAIASGLDDILIITGRNKRSIEDHFDKSYELEYTLQRAGKDRDLKKIRKITDLADICYVRQRDQIGLGDAIKCSERHVDGEAFALFLGHTITKSKIPCMKQLMNVYDKYRTTAIALKEVEKTDMNRYKIVDAAKVEDSIYKIKKIVEKPKNPPSNLAIMGRYVLTSEIYDKIDDHKVDCGSEIHLTNALTKLDSIYGLNFKGESYYIENRLEWLKASIKFALDDDEFSDDLTNYMKSYL